MRRSLHDEAIYVEKLKQLQAAIDEGFASPPTGLNIEDIIKQGFARYLR